MYHSPNLPRLFPDDGTRGADPGTDDVPTIIIESISGIQFGRTYRIIFINMQPLPDIARGFIVVERTGGHACNVTRTILLGDFECHGISQSRT